MERWKLVGGIEGMAKPIEGMYVFQVRKRVLKKNAFCAKRVFQTCL